MHNNKHEIKVPEIIVLEQSAAQQMAWRLCDMYK